MPETAAVQPRQGLPQGEPAFPILSATILEDLLDPLLCRWRERGLRMPMREGQLVLLAFADDISLFATSKTDVPSKVVELAGVLRGRHLERQPERLSGCPLRHTLRQMGNSLS